MKTNIITKSKTLLIAGLVALTASAANAGLLTSTFNSNNSYAGNMFDVSTFNNQLNITGLDINTSAQAGSNVTVALYTKKGSYIGSETNASDWTLADTKTFTSAGSGNATHFDVTDFKLGNNETFGFYVDLISMDYATNSFLNYTNGANTYKNSDLQIDAGIGRGRGFSSASFAPRTWNGNIHYKKVPDAASTFVLFGFGLVAMIGFKRKFRR